MSTNTTRQPWWTVTSNGCWLPVHKRVRVEGRQVATRVAVYELHQWPVPTGQVLYPACGNPQCVRHGHQQPVPPGEAHGRRLQRTLYRSAPLVDPRVIPGTARALRKSNSPARRSSRKPCVRRRRAVSATGKSHIEPTASTVWRAAKQLPGSRAGLPVQEGRRRNESVCGL